MTVISPSQSIFDLSDRTNMFYWQTNRNISAQQDKDIFINRHHHVDMSLVRIAIEQGMKSAGFGNGDTKIKFIHPVIERGLVNTVIPIDLESGKQIVIRMHPTGVKNGYFWVEKKATDLVKNTEVPVYECLYVDDKQTNVPFDYMIMTRVPEKPMQELWPIEVDIEKSLVRETGRLVAHIHKIKPAGFGFFRNDIAKSKSILQGQYSAFSEHIFAAFEEDMRFLREQQVISHDQQKVIEHLFSDHDDCFMCDQGVLVHNDIADWNELTDGKVVTGIMDWDECFSGDPLMELAASSLFFGEPRMTWFKEGYTEVTPLEEERDKYELFKLRYLLSKMHLRKKRSLVDSSPQIMRNLTRGFEAMKEVFSYFHLHSP